MAFILKLRRAAYVIVMGAINFAMAILPWNNLRVFLVKLVGVRCGADVTLERGLRLDFPWRLTIGRNCYIGKFVYLDCRGGKILIGDCTDISEGAIIYTLTHDIQSENFSVKCGDVVVGDRNWICSRAIVLPRTVLGSGNVLGANSVFSGVSKNFSLLIGNPAKCVGQLNSKRASRVRL